MPKKSTTARGGTQRTKPKAQKSFEVVRQSSSDEQVTKNEGTEEVALASYSTTPAPASEATRTPKKAATRAATVATSEVPEVQEEQESPVTTTTATKGSAAARLAARRQSQKSPSKSSATLISAEHYSYVKRDLTFIAVLASFMFIAIIVLYFVLGRGF